MLKGSRRMTELSAQYAVEVHRADIAAQLLALTRPREAIVLLEPLVLAFDPNKFGTPYGALFSMTNAQHTVGDYNRELRFAEMGRQNAPGYSRFFDAKARALAGLGRTDGVIEIVDSFLRAQTHGMSVGEFMSLTAQELRAHGHRHKAEEMAARSVSWYESHPSALPDESWQFGYALWMLGRWRAAIAAHLGEKERAAELLSEAFSKGYPYHVRLHSQLELEPIWDYPPFQELIRPKG
jgi:uncharacterized protein YoaH (UPF0181 family)